MIEFIKSLQEIKKLQQKWEETEILARKTSLQIYLERAIESVGSNNVNNDRRYDLKISKRMLQQVLQAVAPQESVSPTGVVAIVLDSKAPMFVACHQICSALLAGNAVYVYCSQGFDEQICLALKTSLPELPLYFFSGDQQLMEVMLTHPSVHAVSFYGGHEIGQVVARLTGGSGKKAQVSIGYHNAALILADADLDMAAEAIASAFYVGKGQWPVNISEVFVLESKLPEFLPLFNMKLDQLLKRSEGFVVDAKTKKCKVQILAEKGKLIFGSKDNEPIVVEDFSHCSPLHQESMEAAVLFIQPVKYAHEMVKWVKAFDHGGLALVFGPEEKIFKFGSQLPVSKIVANGWIEKLTSLPLGSRKNFIGISDAHAFGGFYSVLTSFDGLANKLSRSDFDRI